MLAKRCEYKHEAAFLSFLPLLISDPDIERKSRRNALTSGVAASFPFASFELSDQKGIFLGLNLYNRSPVFIDLYDDYKYTNGNFAAFGNSGAGQVHPASEHRQAASGAAAEGDLHCPRKGP